MRVYVKTFGCAHNQRDSENICGILVEGKFELVDSVDSADIVVVNSCGVKAKTQNRVASFVNSIPEGKRVFVGGCLPRMVNVRSLCPRVEAVFDPNTILSLPKVIDEAKDVRSDVKEHRLNAPIRRKSGDTAIIPISQGCLGDCTYCSVRFARGPLKSYPADDIVREVQSAVADGCSRINLTAQDTGCWGVDIGSSLPALLKEVVAVEGDFVIRVGMMNPDFAKGYVDELVEIFKSDKILKFLHIPVQSGSDKVLKEMHRKYTISDFEGIVSVFRKEIPGICISTDIIVGYPSETEEDFQETVKMLAEVRPEIVNISKFGSRPRTLAAGLKQLPTQEIKRRSVLLGKLLKCVPS